MWSHHVASGILVPLPGIEPAPSAVKAQSPNHWTDREFPVCTLKKLVSFSQHNYFEISPCYCAHQWFVQDLKLLLFKDSYKKRKSRHILRENIFKTYINKGLVSGKCKGCYNSTIKG